MIHTDRSAESVAGLILASIAATSQTDSPGATVSPVIGRLAPIDGYMVGNPDRPNVTGPISGVTHWGMVAYVNSAIKAGLTDSEYIGAWIGDGHLYLDVSEHVNNRDHALDLATERGELAIYDIVNGVAIDTIYNREWDRN